jgi:hypothetical protein
MKRIITLVLIGIVGFASIASASWFTDFFKKDIEVGAFSDPFISVQLADNPQADYILSTDGTDNSWIVNSGGGGAESLGDLSDVATTTAATGYVLKLQANGTFDLAPDSGGGGGSGEWEYVGDNLQNLISTSTDVRVVGTLQASSTGMFGGDLIAAGSGSFNNVSTTDTIYAGGNITSNSFGQFNNVSTTDSLYVGGKADITGNLAVTGTVTGSNLNISNWDTAYGWGNHASAGYLLQSEWESTTTDALAEGSTNYYWTQSRFDTAFDSAYNATTTLNGFTPSDYLLTSNFNSTWDTRFIATTTWSGDLTVGGNATVIGDLAVTGDVTGANLNISNWDDAYSWGDHALAGYYAAADFNTDWDTRYIATSTFSGNLTVDGDVLVDDEVYGAGWDTSLQVPTKNALYDKIETLGTSGWATTSEAFYWSQNFQSTWDTAFILTSTKSGDFTFSDNLNVTGNTTTTGDLVLGADGARKSCLALRDIDGAGWTFCTVLDGTMTCGTTDCSDTGSNATSTIKLGDNE